MSFICDFKIPEIIIYPPEVRCLQNSLEFFFNVNKRMFETIKSNFFPFKYFELKLQHFIKKILLISFIFLFFFKHFSDSISTSVANTLFL